MGEPHLRPNGSLVVQRLTSDVSSGLVLGGRRWWGLEAAWKRIVRICFTVDCFNLFNIDWLVTGFPINQIGGSWSFTSPAWHLDGLWSAKSWWTWNNSVEKKSSPPPPEEKHNPFNPSTLSTASSPIYTSPFPIDWCVNISLASDTTLAFGAKPRSPDNQTGNRGAGRSCTSKERSRCEQPI